MRRMTKNPRLKEKREKGKEGRERVFGQEENIEERCPIPPQAGEMGCDDTM